MMKKSLMILSLLVISVMMAGVVSAGAPFTSPEDDEFVNDDVLIEWEDGTFGTAYLMYKKDVCDGLAGGKFITQQIMASEGEYLWDISDLEDDVYCIKLVMGDILFGDVEVVIDKKDPSVEITDTEDGDEKDVEVEVTIDIDDNNGVAECKVNWGDGSNIEDCATANGLHDLIHQYGDDGDYEVTVTVSDAAGNEDSDSVEVEVENVAPENLDIDAPDEAIVGQEADFTGMADDVEADLDTLEYFWDFGDGDEGEGEEVSHVYEEAGEYEVTLIVKDKDGGESEPETYDITIFEAVGLDAQIAVVGEALDADFGDDAGVVDNSFATGLVDVTCEIVGDSPGVQVDSDGEDCVVEWLNPTKDERGQHQIIVKATNGETKYYSFDIVVYSWKKEFDEGWNLFSVPFRLEDSSIDVVFSGIMDSIYYGGTSEYVVYQYNSVEDKWYRARKLSTGNGFTATSNKLEEIVPGYAYWLNMEEEATLYVMEKESVVNEIPVPSVSLALGSWNLVGKYGTCSPTIGIWSAFTSLEQNYFANSLLEFDGEKWKSTLGGLRTGKGYWMRTKVSDLDSIDYTPLSGYFC